MIADNQRPTSGGNHHCGTRSNYLKANGATYSRSAPYDKLFAKLVYSATVTFSNGSSDITWNNNGLSVGDPIKLFTSGALPANFTASTHGLTTVGTNYCVTAATTNTFRVGITCGGTVIVAGSAGSGSHTAVNAPWGDGDGSTNFTVPNLMGEFIRGWDGVRGIDAGRQFGTLQADDFKSHTHALTITGSVSPNGPYTYNPSGSNGLWTGGTGLQLSALTLSGTAANTGGTETHPRNVALLPVIRYQ